MRRRGTRAGLIGLSAFVLGLVALGPAPAPAAAVGCVPTTPASCTLRELAVLAGVRIGATAEA
ncbi:MAG: hypothetical protein ACKOBG_00145, partial [Actinomycetota bacterium]